jgi:hypothetical protein
MAFILNEQERNMKRTEQIFAILAIIAILLNILLVPGGHILTLLTLFALISIYFYFAFALFNRIRLRKIFRKESYVNVSALKIIGAIGAGFALSISLTGILFKFMRWPGASVNLMAGLFLLVIISIICLVRYFTNKSAFCKRILIRTSSIGAIGFILFMIPSASITRFKYRNYPAYLEAIEKHQQYPDDVDIMRQMDEERRKMEEKK